MKKIHYLSVLVLSAAALITSGCKKNNSVWDDNQTSGKFKNKSGSSLWGSKDDDRLAFDSDDFQGPEEDDFIALKDEDLKSQISDGAIPQSSITPGDSQSGIPGIGHFSSPSSSLAAVFRSLHFNTDDHILRGQENLASLEKIANYLKQHPNTYVFVEGHCDERGPEAYNLSLGARRANYVRTQLVKYGVNLNQLFTISYGKEKPAVNGHTEAAWNENRRAEFKIYQK